MSFDNKPSSDGVLYQLQGGFLLDFERCQNGWSYRVCTPAFDLLADDVITGVSNFSDAKNQAIKRLIADAVLAPNEPFIEGNHADFATQWEQCNQYGVCPVVLPYIQADGGRFNLDTAVEPVVTIQTSHHADLRQGMSLPFHIADQLFADLDKQESLQNGSKSDCFLTVELNIDYQLEGKNHSQPMTLALGSGNGGIRSHLRHTLQQRGLLPDAKPSIRGRLNASKQTQKSAPAREQERTPKKDKQHRSNQSQL